MKKLLFILCVTLTMNACTKGKDDVAPKGTASEVVGTYALTTFRFQDEDDDLTIPTLPVVEKGKKTYYGSVELTEVSDPEKAQFVLSLTLDSQTFDDIDLGEIDIEKSGSKYNLLSDGAKIGTVSGTTMQIDIKSANARMAFTAKR